jgi:hypothetical protein
MVIISATIREPVQGVIPRHFVRWLLHPIVGALRFAFNLLQPIHGPVGPSDL